MAYDPHYEARKDMQWHVGSEHGDPDNPEYRYDTKGWPYFIGVKESRIGASDFHIATGIQSLQNAKEIAKAHNDKLPR